MYWDVNNLHQWAVSQTLSVGGFEWLKTTAKVVI